MDTMWHDFSKFAALYASLEQETRNDICQQFSQDAATPGNDQNEAAVLFEELMREGIDALELKEYFDADPVRATVKLYKR